VEVILDFLVLIKHLFSDWAFLIVFLHDLVVVAVLLPPEEVVPHLVGEPVDDLVDPAHILLVLVHRSEFEVVEVPAQLPQVQVVQEALDILC